MTRPEMSNRDIVERFDDAAAIANYSDGPRHFVPGLDALHRMASILLAETAPNDARVLVLGAGGGLELEALVLAHPSWRFVGVDPAQAMLDLAERRLGPLAKRVDLVRGYIDDAPDGPFDAAICLLTLHFLDEPERIRTAGAIHARLKPGAPFVAAHSSFPQDASSRDRWLSRYAAYALASGADPQQTAKASAAVRAHLPLFAPETDERILREAGFSDVSLFYAALTWRGWVARA